MEEINFDDQHSKFRLFTNKDVAAGGRDGAAASCSSSSSTKLIKASTAYSIELYKSSNQSNVDLLVKMIG